jgi:hypothetical protein
MPVQRLLTIYLAAVGLHILAAVLVDRVSWPRRRAVAIEAAAIAALLIVYVGTTRLMPFWSRGLYPTERSAGPQMATFQQVLKLADEQAPPGTAILIVGTGMSGHQQLWAPARLERTFFYDEWMWYWQRKHRGPYDPSRTSKYDPARIAEIFRGAYLDRNGIGAVVAVPWAQTAADAAPALRRQFGGAFGLYRVVDPTPIVTLGGVRPATIAIGDERIEATGSSAGGEALVRRNWFPRWRATVNGRSAPIAETDDGYMRVAIPPGPVDLHLTYGFDRADVLARGAALVGVLLGFVALRPVRS